MNSKKRKLELLEKVLRVIDQTELEIIRYGTTEKLEKEIERYNWIRSFLLL